MVNYKPLENEYKLLQTNDKNKMKKSHAKSSELNRQFGGVTATAVVVANMVGAGIFTSSGIMAAQLPHPFYVILCWLLGGIIAMAGALSYVELATRMPQEGGEYIYLKQLYHPALGFLTGWTSFFVGFSAPIGLCGLGFAAYLFSTLQHLQILPAHAVAEHGIHAKIVAAVLIAFFTLLHYLGGHVGPRVQNFLTALKIALILALVLAGLFLGKGHITHITTTTTQPFDLMTLGSAMMIVMFSYSGWNASTYIAGEIKNPQKTLPISLALGTAIVIFLYLILNLFYFYALPYEQIKGQINIAELALIQAFGPGISQWLGAVIGIVLLSSLSAYIMIGPRVYYAMARDKLFFGFASLVHPRFTVPGRAILIQGVVAILMVLMGSFEQLLVYVGFALGIFPWLAVAALFKARRLKVGENSAVKVWGYPWVPLFFLLTNLLLMIFTYVRRPKESTYAVLTILLGIPCYFLWIKLVNKKNKLSIKE